jgi:AcrR family transcriptional regulator
MSAARTPRKATADLASAESSRLTRSDRRETLLDAALALVAAGAVDDVSIETVADKAGVSRPLVYKHFANRADILTALYLREGAKLHEQMTSDVDAAETTEAKFRALFRDSLRATNERARIFAALRSAAELNSQMRRVQRDRDRQTVAYYAKHVIAEYGLSESEAEIVVAMLLAAIAPALTRYHHQPSDEYAAELEETYMTLVTSVLAAMSGRGKGRGRKGVKNLIARPA